MSVVIVRTLKPCLTGARRKREIAGFLKDSRQECAHVVCDDSGHPETLRQIVQFMNTHLIIRAPAQRQCHVYAVTERVAQLVGPGQQRGSRRTRCPHLLDTRSVPLGVIAVVISMTLNLLALASTLPSEGR